MLRRERGVKRELRFLVSLWALCCPQAHAAAAGEPATEGDETLSDGETHPDRDSLVTDRPGNGNAATTVQPYRLQVETSANFLRDGGSDATQLSFPSLLRFGVLSFAELRAGTSVVGLDLEGGGLEATDTIVGTKVSVPGLQAFDLAASVDVSLPTGSGAFGGNVVGMDARVLASFSLPAGFGLLLNGGIDLPDTGAGRTVRPMHVVNLGYVPPIGKRQISVFVESFGRHPFDGAPQLWQVDAGAAYLLTPDVQLDAFTQHGLTDVAPDFQVAVGVSGRWGR